MKTKHVSAALAVALTTVLAGCASPTGSAATPQRDRLIGYKADPAPDAQYPVHQARGGYSRELGELIYLAAQTMAERSGVLAKDKPVLVATMVSVDDLNRSSTFGRLSSQLIANRLAQRGYMVKDVSYMGALTLVPYTGELVLSRDATRVGRSVDAQAIVAGTYAVGGRQIFLNIRLLRATDGAILSSADVVVPLDINTEPMVEADGPLAAMTPALDGPLYSAPIREPRG